MDDNKENQENELLALNSIFEDEDTFMALEDNSGGSFYANVQLPADCSVMLSGHMVQQARALCAALKEGEENSWTMPVISLPPVELNFQYPSDYPSQSAPKYTLSCKWLSVQQLTTLCEKLDEIWDSNQGEVVIFQWTEFLKSETLDHLQISCPITLDTSGLPRTVRQRSQQDTRGGDQPAGPGGDAGGATLDGAGAVIGPNNVRAVQDIAALPHLIPTIVAHDNAMREHAFITTCHPCRVCFDDKFGKDCIRFHACGHIFCKACMKEHFMVKIADGDMKGLICPENKCETPALPTQVKELVDPELYKKYEEGLLDLSLSEMGDIVYCPRIACQSPVVREEGNMGMCPICRFAFCVLCKTTYHGVAPCKVSKERYKQIMEEYETATDDDRSILEQRYGKHKLRQVIENCNSEQWIQKHSKECPQCGRAIQKFDGCNKMTCTKCRCYFCWLCFLVLPRSDPYSHYRGNNKCANRLFEGMGGAGGGGGGDDDDDDEEEHEGEVNVVNIENWWQFV